MPQPKSFLPLPNSLLPKPNRPRQGQSSIRPCSFLPPRRRDRVSPAVMTRNDSDHESLATLKSIEICVDETARIFSTVTNLKRALTLMLEKSRKSILTSSVPALNFHYTSRSNDRGNESFGSLLNSVHRQKGMEIISRKIDGNWMNVGRTRPETRQKIRLVCVLITSENNTGR